MFLSAGCHLSRKRENAAWADIEYILNDLVVSFVVSQQQRQHERACNYPPVQGVNDNSAKAMCFGQHFIQCTAAV